MLGLRDKKQCSGCTACMNSCPHQAIRMQPDRLGFLYPRIDRTLCTRCGVCEKVCPFTGQARLEAGRPLPAAYAVRHQDLRQVAASQSGAAFIALSDSVMELGGVVYGAGYEGHFRVVHQRAVTVDERDRFRGSKYVQSDLGTAFQSVKTDLQAGKTVLFTGTPCQTAGLSAGDTLPDSRPFCLPARFLQEAVAAGRFGMPWRGKPLSLERLPEIFGACPRSGTGGSGFQRQAVRLAFP